jgi:hypothetical protein
VPCGGPDGEVHAEDELVRVSDMAAAQMPKRMSGIADSNKQEA